MSGQQPLISIIITVLNGEKTLSRCLSSIGKQTFSDYELVIVDGGSKDNTVKIINESNILNKTVFILPGSGIYAGLNMGIKLAKGQWIYFIGADDELAEADTLKKVNSVIKSKEDSKKIIMFYYSDIFNDLLYDEQMKIASDYELNLKLAMKKVPYQYVDIVFCNFGGEGVSEKLIKQRYLEMKQIHKRLFIGIGRLWVLTYFQLRQDTGLLLRSLNLLSLRVKLKKIFG